MNILLVGDVVGKPGRQAVRDFLPGVISREGVDFTIINGENAAGGVGLTPDLAEELLSYGADVITTGNHVWDKRELVPFLEKDDRVVRPLNYPPGTPGRGAVVAASRSGVPVAVISLAGRVFSIAHLDCPFRAADAELAVLRRQVRVIVVDIHAEATSEKVAMGLHLDGRVTAVIGTHTHVQTADARVLRGGTAYMTDVGMTGPQESVIGIRHDLVLQRFLTQLPVRFEVATGDVRFMACVIAVSESSGRATAIRALNLACAS
jgi:hypothetical protein